MLLIQSPTHSLPSSLLLLSLPPFLTPFVCLSLPSSLLLLSLPPFLTPFVCLSLPSSLLLLSLPPFLTPFVVFPSLPYSFLCLSLPPSFFPFLLSSSLSYLASSKVNYEATKHGQANSRRFAVNYTCFDNNLNSCTYVVSNQCNQPLVVQCIQGQLLIRINYF